MDVKVVKTALLDAPATSNAASANGLITLTGLPPIKTSDWTGRTIDVVPYQAQALRVTTLTFSSAVVASTLYRIRVGQRSSPRLGSYDALSPVGYTSPSVLTGTAADDKHNAYVALAYKINRMKQFNVVAYPLITIAITSPSGSWTVGTTVTGGTSGATGKLISKSASPGTITVGVISGTFAAETITGADGSSGTGATPTKGVGLRVEDLGPYNGILPFYPRVGKCDGPHEIYAEKGFLPTDIVVTTAHAVEFGNGTNLLAMKPIMEYTSGNLARGTWAFPQNADPVAGSLYNLVLVTVKKNIDPAMAMMDAVGASEQSRLTYAIWANKDATNYAAWLSALQAL